MRYCIAIVIVILYIDKKNDDDDCYFKFLEYTRIEISRLITVQVGVKDWVIDLSHLMMHRIGAFVAMIAFALVVS